MFLLKTRNSRISTFIFILILAGTLQASAAKTVVTYYSSDSVRITADHYFQADSLPYVILLHEQKASRGEFQPVVKRFLKMNFNCLVVDLRNGDETNYISNETVKCCRASGASQSFKMVEEDIHASISFVQEISKEKIVLIGAGANGGLALKVANENEAVYGCVALSPGEYFIPAMKIEQEITGMQKPVLLTGTKFEHPYLEQMVSGIGESYKSVFSPMEHEGARSVQAFLPENPSNGEYWLALLLFIKDIN